MDEKIEIENINTPGKITRVNRNKYLAMKQTLLQVIPKRGQGLNQNQMMELVKVNADQKFWPNGEKAAWWAKTVQLDLEAKGILQRQPTKPLTWLRI